MSLLTRLSFLFFLPLSVAAQPLVMVVQPVNSENSEEAVRVLFDDQVAAAIIPTRLVGDYDGLSVVTNTAEVPSPAFSVSPRVDAETVT